MRRRLPEISRNFPFGPFVSMGRLMETEPAKRTQTKPLEAGENPGWPVKNKETRHWQGFAGDETNPLSVARVPSSRRRRAGLLHAKA
jgi:hypothetical protein